MTNYRFTLQIDFQFTMWSTPALDFEYIHYMLAHDELVEVHRADLQQVYLDELHDTLKKINYLGKLPSMSDLQLSLLGGASLDLLFAVLNIPPRLFDWRTVDMDELMAKDNSDVYGDISKKLYHIPEYRQVMLQRFRRLEKTGIMD